MNKEDIRRLDMLVRVDQYGDDHPLLPANARVTVLLGSIKTVIAQVNTLGGTQESGRGQFRGGASERRRISRNLRKEMRKISDIALVLDPATYPGVREQFRMPATKAYQDLQNRAQAFLTALGPIKAAFVERDLPADFDEQLSGVLAEFTTATQLKESGRADKVQGTTGITAATKAGVLLVRELGAILRVRYENDPGMLAAFKSAAHIERPPRRDKAEDGTGGEQAPAVPLAVNGAATNSLVSPGAQATMSNGHVTNGADHNEVMLA